MFVLGLFSLLLDYTLKYVLSNDRAHKDCKDRCYELMRRIARKNPKVTTMLQLHIHTDVHSFQWRSQDFVLTEA